MRKLFFLMTVSLFTSIDYAQPPVEKLNNWAAPNPIEKIYLHCDRDEYIAGQTIWFKSYLYSEFLPDYKSSTIFVELINTPDVILSRQILPIAAGVSRGQFELPDTLSSGQYIIRAYTATMLNQNPDFICTQKVYVTGKEKKNIAVAPGPLKKIRMEFFPEGGNFVTGLPNTLAFKATLDNGWPVDAAGAVKNSKDEIITEFTSYHDGMGMIDLTAADNETYYAVLKNDPSAQKYYLPQTVAKGIVFRLLTGDDGIHFEILQPKNDPMFQAAYMVGQMQHKVVFKQQLKAGTSSLGGIVKTNNMASGILHITIFNKDGVPLAERLSFIDNKEYRLPAQLATDTINFSPRGKNHFTLAFTDTVIGSFSVSVTDAGYSSSMPQRENNIVSSLLLTADIRGYVHNPAWYFSSGSDSAKYAMDLVMMTNGWRRFKWSQLMHDSLANGNYNDPKYITLSGRVTLEGTKKPFAGKDMLMFIVTADSSRSVQMIKTNADGYYNADSIIFFGKARILLSDIHGKKSRFVDIKPGPDLLHLSYSSFFYNKYDLLFPGDPSNSNESLVKKMNDEYNASIKANGVILSEIVVKSHKKTALEETEEKYASGAFSGDSRKTFDLLNTDDARTYQNIFDYLEARVPGLAVIKNSETGEVSVYYRQLATMSSLNPGMDIFLDEVPADATSISLIPVNQIAMVKVYSTFVGSTGNGAGGALAIYLKKGTDYFNSLPSAGEIINYDGFSVIKEFYSPDYSVPAINNKITPDQRMTLTWQPDIYVAGVNTKVPVIFYNNDRTKTFRVVAEGMTADGKLLMIEKLITVKGF